MTDAAQRDILSGHCNSSNPNGIHRNCAGSYLGHRCRCERPGCHNRPTEEWPADDDY